MSIDEAERLRTELRETVKRLWAAEMRAERQRVAWASAAGRAAGLRDELDETRAEMAALRQAYAEVLQVLRGDTP